MGDLRTIYTDQEGGWGSDAFLKAEILKNSLCDEKVELWAVPTGQVELHQHGATALEEKWCYDQ